LISNTSANYHYSTTRIQSLPVTNEEIIFEKKTPAVIEGAVK